MACHVAEGSGMKEGVEWGVGVPNKPQNATHDVVCRYSGDTLLHGRVGQDLRAQLLNTCACIHSHP